MTSISSAILCDFAQVREGLLFVSSGALTRLYRAKLPAPLGITVAVVVEVGYEEIDRNHELIVAIKQVDTAEQIGRMTGNFKTSSADLEPGESLYVPIIINISRARAKAYGPHDVQVAVDGDVGAQLTFYIRPTPAGRKTAGS